MPDICFANIIAGSWIALGLAEDKGANFAEVVIASDRWAFPRMSISEAREVLAERGEHCHCPRCKPRRVDGPAAARQLELF